MSAPSIERQPSLAELSEDQFEERYGCDRFTATVVSNRLRYVVGHMSTGLLHRAFSPIISYYYDFATAVSGPPEQGYPMAATNNGLLVFLGTVGDAVRNVVGEYGPDRLAPGDLMICNDPWRGGNHVNDLMLTRPVFHQREIVGFVTIRAHQLDMGGTVRPRLRRGGRRRDLRRAGAHRQARWARRGRPQRLLAPGPDVHQRHRLGQQDRHRHRVEDAGRPRVSGELGDLPPAGRRGATRHRDLGAAARWGDLLLLGGGVGAAQRDAGRPARDAGRRCLRGRQRLLGSPQRQRIEP